MLPSDSIYAIKLLHIAEAKTIRQVELLKSDYVAKKHKAD
jgi:hypothetical protein